MVNKNFLKKFLHYISFDTQSNEESLTCPSTSKQLLLGQELVKELKEMGLDNAFIDEHGYVYAYLEANNKSDEVIGLIAHMDTSDEASGKDVKPQIIDSYDGKPIIVNQELGIILDPKEFNLLNEQIGHTLITTDGTTLLGADDKSGVAIIMTCVEEIIKNNLKHCGLIITFTPDEEIGRGADLFNVSYYEKHHCHKAYTIDGDIPSHIECENFNAASCKVVIKGKSIHPGSAYQKMINSQIVAMEFFNTLPPLLRPECTKGYEGFNHLTSINGTVSETIMNFIIRNHDMAKFNEQKKMFYDLQKKINDKYHKELVKVEIKDSYYNMKEKIDLDKSILKKAELALLSQGLDVKYVPIRGGTDGARLSFMGILCPNLGTGGQNFHGPFEYLDVDLASIMVEVLKELVKNY